MSDQLIKYELKDKIATITLNDGGKNLISPKMIDAINKALDKAKKENAVVVITGNDTIFSAGFDLKILKTGAINTYKMLIGGFQLAERLLSFPTPVIIACNGHAIAMGVFLLLSADYRIGVDVEHKIVANEVAIGLTLPYAAIEICRQRLHPAHFVRATLLSENYSPANAVEAGFLDKVVPKEKLMEEAYQLAEQFSKLDLKAHYQSKLRVRQQLLSDLKQAISNDRIDFAKLGVKRLIGK